MDGHVKMILIMLLESSATVYQDADGTFCVVGVKYSRIRVQELWEMSDLMLMLGIQCAAMLLWSINKHFREVLPGGNVRDNNINAGGLPSKVLTIEYQDADPFCMVIVNGIDNWKRSSRRVLGM
jgi:hypothetical protein